MIDQNMIKGSSLTNESDDNGSFQVAQVSYFDRAADSYMVHPYGFGSNPPVGSYCLTFSVNGDESNRYTIACTPDKRIKNLKPGETYFANLLTGTQVLCSENGDMVSIVKGNKSVTIDQDLNITVGGDININVTGDNNININGNSSVVVSGDLNATVGGNATTTIAGDVNSTISGGAIIEIDGDLVVSADSVVIDSDEIDLGIGGEPIARLGDAVQVDTGTGTGTITSASLQNTSA